MPEDDTARAWLIELRSDPRNVELEVDRVTLLVREHARELGRCESRRRTRLRAARTAALRRIGGFSLNAVIAGLREEGLASKAPRRTTVSKWHGRGAAHITAAVSWRLRGGVFDPKERHRLEMLRSVFAASRADAGVPRPARRKAA